MTPGLYIDDAQRKRIVVYWIKVSLSFLHIWATAAVVAVIFWATEQNVEALAGIFSTCTFGIGATLVILLADRALDAVLDWVPARRPPATVTETTTRTVEPLGSSHASPAD